MSCYLKKMLYDNRMVLDSVLIEWAWHLVSMVLSEVVRTEESRKDLGPFCFCTVFSFRSPEWSLLLSLYVCEEQIFFFACCWCGNDAAVAWWLLAVAWTSGTTWRRDAHLLRSFNGRSLSAGRICPCWNQGAAAAAAALRAIWNISLWVFFWCCLIQSKRQPGLYLWSSWKWPEINPCWPLNEAHTHLLHGSFLNVSVNKESKCEF